MKWKYFFAWIPGIPIAIINGSIREYLFKSYFSELVSHQLSVISFIILFGMYVWFILPLLKLGSKHEALRLGIIWLSCTVIFEFLFGHYIMGNPWSVLLHDYNLLQGRVWIVVLLWILISPYLLYNVRHKVSIIE